jgi:hypothetical protein
LGEANVIDQDFLPALALGGADLMARDINLACRFQAAQILDYILIPALAKALSS